MTQLTVPGVPAPPPAVVGAPGTSGGRGCEPSPLLRGLHILDIARATGGTTMSRLIRTSGLPSSTAYRLVGQLVSAGFLVSVDDKVVPSDKLSERPAVRAQLRAPARSVVAELSRRTNLTAVVTVRVHTSALCLDVHPARSMQQVSYRPGQIRALYAGASALPLLARAPRSVAAEVLRGPIKQFTADTLSADEIGAELRRIRRLGYAVTRGTVTPGACAIGVPVLRQERCIAALSLVGSVHQVEEEPTLLARLRIAADRLADAW